MLVPVVSTKWLEERCVRLRVVVKSDNCGDAQDCSAKGVCFTNGSMVSNTRNLTYFHDLRMKDRCPRESGKICHKYTLLIFVN